MIYNLAKRSYGLLVRELQSMNQNLECPLKFRCWGRQLSCFNLGLKSDPRVSPVAERLVLRMPAPAKRHHGATGKTERVSGSILYSDVFTEYSIWTVVDDYDSSFLFFAHYSLLIFFAVKPESIIVAHRKAHQKVSLSTLMDENAPPLAKSLTKGFSFSCLV